MTMTNKEQQIAHNMKALDLTREEAEELWAFDNDEIDNEEVVAMEEESEAIEEEKRAKIDAAQVKHRKEQIKAEEKKEDIVENVMNHVVRTGFAHQPMQMGSNSITFMDDEGNFYTVKVTKHRSQPNGYVYDPNKFINQ